MSLFQECAQTGRNPHMEIHAPARSHYQLYTPYELENAQRQYRQAQAEQRRAQEKAERDAERNYRNKIGNKLARLGGLTTRDLTSHDPYRRQLAHEARRLGFWRAGMGGY
jgi:hypothetical protein